jgi:hypothetical protein
MGSNKEAVVAEKNCSAHFNQKVLIAYSDVIFSDQFPTWEGFKEKVSQVWAAEWERIASADWSRTFSNGIQIFVVFFLSGFSLVVF